LSVVVIGKNEERYISSALRSAQVAIAGFDDAEIVYVDSASTDRSVEIALALGVRVISLRPEWELSPSAGRYVGFHHTLGELIMFLDADTTLEPDWLWKAVRWFDCPEIGAVAGFLRDFDDQGRLLPHVGEKSPTAREIKTLRGSGLYRRSAMEKVGTFNPYLVTNEEAELALRLRQGGWKLMHLPYPMGRHLRGVIGLKAELRSWRLGRAYGCGMTLRYACHEGTWPRFCFEYLRSTMLFMLACLLLTPGLFLFLAGRVETAKLFLWPILLGSVAIAIKKRSLLGPLDYVVSHGLTLFSLIAGALKTRIRDPRNYLLDAVEIKSNYRTSNYE
jgi:glycosyltransferase involved in cell wall biosynthesis